MGHGYVRIMGERARFGRRGRHTEAGTRVAAATGVGRVKVYYTGTGARGEVAAGQITRRGYLRVVGVLHTRAA